MPFLVAIEGFLLEGEKRYDLDELLAKAKADDNNTLNKIRIGRSKDNEIIILSQDDIESLDEKDQRKAKHISRLHATIWKTELGGEGKYVIKDGGVKRSNSGTFVEDKRVESASEDHPRLRPLEFFTAAGFKVLEDGDTIYLGSPGEEYCQVFKYEEK